MLRTQCRSALHPPDRIATQTPSLVATFEKEISEARKMKLTPAITSTIIISAALAFLTNMWLMTFPVLPLLTYSTPVSDLYRSWERDHCWRNRTVGDRAAFDILVTGAGYSATGYFAKTFTLAGYPIGHEEIHKFGASDWLMASRKNNSYSPWLFKHIFLLVRHPLRVLHSQYGTNWNFVWTEKMGVRSDVAQDETLLRPEQFSELSVDFKTMEWWLIYTLLGENIAECYIRAEDISARLLLNICLRSELPDCGLKDWDSIVFNFTHYNSHNKNANDSKSWEELELLVKTEEEMMVLHHARQVCSKFYGEELC